MYRVIVTYWRFGYGYKVTECVHPGSLSRADAEAEAARQRLLDGTVSVEIRAA